jgi:hypothetical protein
MDEGFRNKYDMEELRGVAQVGDEIGLNDFLGAIRQKTRVSSAINQLDGAISGAGSRKESERCSV